MLACLRTKRRERENERENRMREKGVTSDDLHSLIVVSSETVFPAFYFVQIQSNV